MSKALAVGMVENGMPEKMTSGAGKSYPRMIAANDCALPFWAIKRGSSIRFNFLINIGLVSMASNRACAGISRNTARVVPPVPGPNSTAVRA